MFNDTILSMNRCRSFSRAFDGEDPFEFMSFRGILGRYSQGGVDPREDCLVEAWTGPVCSGDTVITGHPTDLVDENYCFTVSRTNQFKTLRLTCEKPRYDPALNKPMDWPWQEPTHILSTLTIPASAIVKDSGLYTSIFISTFQVAKSVAHTIPFQPPMAPKRAIEGRRNNNFVEAPHEPNHHGLGRAHVHFYVQPQCTGNDGLQFIHTESIRPGKCRTSTHPFKSFSVTHAQSIHGDNCHAEVFEGAGCGGEKALVGTSIETSKRTDCHTPVNDVHDTTHFRSIRLVCTEPKHPAPNAANPSFPIGDIITTTKSTPSTSLSPTSSAPRPSDTYYKPPPSAFPTVHPIPDPNTPPLPTPDLNIHFHSHSSCRAIHILDPDNLPPDISGTIAFYSGQCQNAAQAFQAFHLTSNSKGDSCWPVVYPRPDCEGRGLGAWEGRGEDGLCYDVPRMREGKAWVVGRGGRSVRVECAAGG